MSRALWCVVVGLGVAVTACSATSKASDAPAPSAANATTGASTTTDPATTATPPTTAAPATTVAAPTTAPAPAPCQVALLADSVGYDLYRNGLEQALAGVGCPITWSRAARGLPMSDGVKALSDAGKNGTDVVVIVQGYAKARSSAGEFQSLIDEVMKAAGDRVVVWPLYGRTPDCSALYSTTLDEYNQWLQEATQRWPKLRLADYPAVIDAHPEYAELRCPHLLDSGSKAVSTWLAGEVRHLVDLPATAPG